MNKIFPILSLLIVTATMGGVTPYSAANQHASPKHASPRTQPADTEDMVIDYIREHIRPGEPLEVSELYNEVFTKLEERQVLNKFYNAFFRIPLFLAEYQEKYGSPPSLRTIAQQFDLHNPGNADVLLRVMEADPRVPRFLTRDSETGEITRVDVAMIRSDPRFGQSVERQLSGWEGKTAPNFNLAGMDGHTINSATLSGKVVLLYVWFTGCPPCMKEAPRLVALQHEFSSRGFIIVGANADKLLGLGYQDEIRQRYIKEQKINFPVADWTEESDSAYGKISIYPTLFLIDGKGVIVHHWVGYVAPEELRKYLSDVIK